MKIILKNMIVINQHFIERTRIVDLELELDSDSILKIQPRQKKDTSM